MNNSQIIKNTKQSLHETMADMWSEIKCNERTSFTSCADTSLIVKTCELHHQLQDTLKLLQKSYEKDEQDIRHERLRPEGNDIQHTLPESAPNNPPLRHALCKTIESRYPSND